MNFREWLDANPIVEQSLAELGQVTIDVLSGMAVDTDGLVIGAMRDWVSVPPFYRGD